MAKYTLELGTIVEGSKCGVFDFEYDFYEPMLKKIFEEKFIDHYYVHEIGFETIMRFKMRLRSKLNLIMPRYTQLYRTEIEAKDINFLLNKDLKEVTKRRKENEDTSVVDSNSNNNTNFKESSLNDGNATLNNSDLTTINNDSSDSTAKTLGDNHGSENEEIEFISQGNIGVTSSAELLEKWRSTIINIDQMIIEECKTLFMTVY